MEGVNVDSAIKWGERIPILRDRAFQLLNLSNDLVSACNGPYIAYDTLGLMIASFTHIQIDHLKSICLLIDAGLYSDALIISRSSVEGLFLLLWSVHGPKNNIRENRPLCWAAFDGLKLYREMIKHDVDKTDIEVETAIFDHMLQYQHLFVSPKAKEKRRKGDPWPDDPYIRRWPPKSNSEIVKDLENLGLLDKKHLYYKGVYGHLSQWTHGSSRSFADTFRYEENHISNDTNKIKFYGAGAIIFGVEALGRSSILFDDHFELGFQKQLFEQGSKFNAWPDDNLYLFD